MSSKNFTARKVPILGTAMTILATGSEYVVSGHYIEGGMLMVSGLAMVGLYETYQVQQLPEPLSGAHVEDAADRITNEVKRKTQLDEFLGVGGGQSTTSQKYKSESQSSGGSQSGEESSNTSQSSQSSSEDTSVSSQKDTETTDEDMDISAAEI